MAGPRRLIGVVKKTRWQPITQIVPISIRLQCGTVNKGLVTAWIKRCWALAGEIKWDFALLCVS